MDSDKIAIAANRVVTTICTWVEYQRGEALRETPTNERHATEALNEIWGTIENLRVHAPLWAAANRSVDLIAALVRIEAVVDTIADSTNNPRIHSHAQHTVANIQSLLRTLTIQG